VVYYGWFPVNAYNQLTIGKYLNRDSVINRLDPRTKIISVFLLSLFVFYLKSYLAFALFAVFLLLVIMLSKLSLKLVLGGLGPLAWIIWMTFFLHVFFTNGKVLASVGFIKITVEGISLAFFVTIRLILLIIAASLLTLTTAPEKIAMGLEKLLMPLKFIGLPPVKIAFMVTLAIRFIPVLFLETGRIIKAQKSRGASLSKGGIFMRIKSFIAMIVPLLAGALRRADEIDEALKSRGFDIDAPRTQMNSLKWTLTDSVVIIIVGVFTMCLKTIS